MSTPTLYIVRGLPGSGKSTLARSRTPIVFEADDYFYDDKGNYNFSRDKLKDAHAYCFRRAIQAMASEDKPDIAVANTFTRRWEAAPYILAAQAFDYSIEILEPDTEWANNVTECYNKCVHNVPLEAIEGMQCHYEAHHRWL